MRFTKMQACGNDFICLNGLERKQILSEDDVRKLCDRHFGIGADGVILIGYSESADFSMKIWNADGSEAQMCGNGIRCLGKFVYDRGYARRKRFKVMTDAGIHTLQITEGADYSAEEITVEMAVPSLKGVPADKRKLKLIEEKLGKNQNEELFTVSFGNPHCVLLANGAEELNISHIGPMIEKSGAFPNGINVELVTVISGDEISVKVWERGVGETLSCGTGACASAFAVMYAGKCGREITVKMAGGPLKIEQKPENNRIYLTGGASFICEGTAF